MKPTLNFQKRFDQDEDTPIGILNRLFTVLNDHHQKKAGQSFVAFRDPKTLRTELNLESEGTAGDWDEVFHWVEKYLAYSVNTDHPMFLNRMWSGANLPSIIGEIVTALTNTSACTFESAPVSTLMEKRMIQEMLTLVGFHNGEGQMTTGSSNANLLAMLSARDQVNREIRQKGYSNQKQLVAYVNSDSHYSMDKAAALLGIGTENLKRIQTDSRGGMDLKCLEWAIRQTLKEDAIPFFVGATAGTTVRGAYDDLAGLVALKNAFGFWLHVDGAWGGAAVFSDALRSRFLDGLEKADSFTFDFHKMPGTALICNVLLMNNHPGALAQSCSIGDTSYIFRDEPADDDNVDLGSFSLQCGRRVDSLKWFLDWRFHGKNGFGERIERYYDLVRYTETVVQQTKHLELVVPRESFNLCFRFVDPLIVDKDAFNLQLRNALYQQEKSLVGSGYVNGEFCLRLLIANPAVNEGHIRSFFNELIETAHSLLEEI